MKKILLSIIAIIALVTPSYASQWDLSSLLKSVSSNTTTGTDTTSTSSSQSSALSSLISGVASSLGIGSSEVTVANLVGTWNYSAPAVAFNSENLLLKAGGAAAATTVEEKLAPYYKRVGLNALVITIAEDSTFTFQVRSISIPGVITKNTETGNLVFQFQAFGQFNIGAMESNITLSGDTMELTFDVSKLITLIEKIGKLSGNSTIQSVSSLLNQYDGMTAGFEMTRKSES